MKAEKTRHFIESAIDRIYGHCDHFKNASIIQAHEESALKELSELERLASEYQSPEMQQLIEIGRATVKAFEEDEDGIQFIRKIPSVEELLQWAKGE
jgi:hypothetical protein